MQTFGYFLLAGVLVVFSFWGRRLYVLITESRKGNLRLKLRDFRGAIDCYSKVIDLNDSIPDILTHRAVAYLQLQQWDNARDDLNRALNIKPDFRDAIAFRSIARGSSGDAVGARSDSLNLYEMEKENPDLLNDRAMLFTGWFQFEAAEIFFEQALKLSPNRSDILCARSLLRNYQGEFESSIDDARLAISLSPDMADAHLRHATALSNLCEYENALFELEKAVVHRPEHAETLWMKGVILTSLSRGEEAIKLFDQAIDLNPQLFYFWSNRGMAKYILDRWDDGIVDFDHALALNPNDIVSLVFMGLAEYELGNSSESLVNLRKAISVSTQDTRGRAQDIYRLYILAVAYRQMGDFVQMLDMIDQLERIDADQIFIDDLRAVMYASCPDQNLRDGEQALRYATRACEKSKWIDSHRITNLAAACAEVGDFTKALEWINQTIGMDACFPRRRKFMRELFQRHEPYRHPVVE